MSSIDEHETLEAMRYELRQWIRGANITDRQRERLTEIANGVVQGGALHRIACLHPATMRVGIPDTLRTHCGRCGGDERGPDGTTK
jgi:hypothetical protein